MFVGGCLACGRATLRAHIFFDSCSGFTSPTSFAWLCGSLRSQAPSSATATPSIVTLGGLSQQRLRDQSHICPTLGHCFTSARFARGCQPDGVFVHDVRPHRVVAPTARHCRAAILLRLEWNGRAAMHALLSLQPM